MEHLDFLLAWLAQQVQDPAHHTWRSRPSCRFRSTARARLPTYAAYVARERLVYAGAQHRATSRSSTSSSRPRSGRPPSVSQARRGRIELDRTGSNCWQPCSLLSLFLRVFLLLFLRVCACTALLSSLSVSACVSASVSACVCVYKAYTEACACMLLLVSAMLDACVCVCVYSTKCVESAVGTGFCGAFLACLTAAGQPQASRRPAADV